MFSQPAYTRRAHHRASERGAFLVSVLVLVVFLGGLSLTFLQEGLTDRSSIDHRETTIQALEIAESGVCRAEMEIVALQDLGDDGIGTVSGAFGSGTYEVSAAQDANFPDRWTIDARGEKKHSVRRIQVGVRRRASGMFIEGLFARGELRLAGDMQTDSYDSNLGAYGPQAVNVDAGGTYAGTRGSVGSNLSISALGTGAVVRGNAVPGPLHEVDMSGDPKIYGDIYRREREIDVLATPKEEFEAALANNDNDRLLAGGPQTGYNQNTMTFAPKGKAEVVLDGGTYFFTAMNMAGQTKLRIRGPCKVYVTGPVDLSGGMLVNESGVPASFQLFVHPYSVPYGNVPGKMSVKLSGGASAAAAVYAPYVPVTYTGGGSFFGAIVGNTIDVHGTSYFHYDESLRLIDGGSEVVVERLYWRDTSPPRR